ncbi:MAG: hypothetical protein P8K79_12920, partial [Mariniblastus sp.]|nr:hypothetical protein [Mariniblastus sp.]
KRDDHVDSQRLKILLVCTQHLTALSLHSDYLAGSCSVQPLASPQQPLEYQNLHLGNNENVDRKNGDLAFST